nr:CsbD family protein [uncultured Desulfuromonas sp.]
MKISRKDQAKGLFHQAKGSAKEIAGKISGNPQLEAEGAGEKVAGKVQEKIGKAEKLLDS